MSRRASSGGSRPTESSALSPERYVEDLEALTAQEFDVLVLGGGIVGAGIALDAASRGLKVAIVEAQDWAAGSSSQSSKLIHGGLRYLEQREFGLVREALRERATLLRTAPHLVHATPFVLPLKNGVFERAYVAAGLVIYDGLARFGARGNRLPLHRQLSRGRALQLVPGLDRNALTGAIQYWDAQVDDARHTLDVVRTAASYGAIATNRVVARALVREQGRVVGANVVSTETGAPFEVRASAVISATGVWTEKFEGAVGVSGGLRIAPSKGVHLVVPRGAIDSTTALIIRTPKSVLFVLPWGDHWIVGTTDTSWALDVDYPASNASDIEYILTMLNSVLRRPVALGDIESVYVGLRPLIASDGTGTTEIPREHAIALPSPGLVAISGGKYTTYRVMAKDAVDAMLAHVGLKAAPSTTAEIPLVGATNYAAIAADRELLAAKSGLSLRQIDRLLNRYGSAVLELLSRAESDPQLLQPLRCAPAYLRIEVDYAVSHEGARHLDDVLMRRTRISIETRDRGTLAADEVAQIMATRLGWTIDQIAEEVHDYRSNVTARTTGEHALTDADALIQVRAGSPNSPYP